MSKIRVLVFPCGSEIGLEVYNSVHHSTHFELFGLNSVDDHGKFVYENYIDGIGFINDFNFIDKLNEIIKINKIEIIYPTMDSVISFLKKNESLIHAKILGSSYETASICESKLRTYELLNPVVKCPKIFKSSSVELKFPLFSKPIVGYGSRNTKKILKKDELVDFDFNNNLLLEFLPGDEYTIDCFTNLDGNLIFVGARERHRTMNGISVNTKSNKLLSLEFKNIANKINNIVKFKGSWFFQMKRDINNEHVLLEIACRFAGSSSVHRIKGINFALSNLFLEFGKSIDFLINDFEVELDRCLSSDYKINLSYNTVFIDYDDTIILNEKVNLDAIRFLFHCINNNKEVILITKHSGNLLNSLECYKISQIFKKIIHLKSFEEKSDIILDNLTTSSIFIDDSFEERNKVYLNTGIPVFSPDSLCALLNVN